MKGGSCLFLLEKLIEIIYTNKGGMAMTNSKEMNMYNENEINNIYGNIKELVINSRNKVYTTVNTEMLNLYWNIGKIIMEIQQGDERASYGEAVLEKLSEKLTREFGKGFSIINLRRMRRFYCLFPIRSTLLNELSWSHYLELIKFEAYK